MFLDDQVKACVQTSRKDLKVDFAGSSTYISSEIACIFPEKDPGYHQYSTSGRDMSKKRGGKRPVDAAASGGHNHNKFRKENVVDISDTSCYYSPDECKKLSIATKSKLLSNPKKITEKDKRAGDKKRFTTMSSSSVTATAKADK